MAHELSREQLDRIVGNLDRLVAAGRVLPDEAAQLRAATDDDTRLTIAAGISARHQAEAATRTAHRPD